MGSDEDIKRQIEEHSEQIVNKSKLAKENLNGFMKTVNVECTKTDFRFDSFIYYYYIPVETGTCSYQKHSSKQN